VPNHKGSVDCWRWLGVGTIDVNGGGPDRGARCVSSSALRRGTCAEGRSVSMIISRRRLMACYHDEGSER
jgi:hypothetical protein